MSIMAEGSLLGLKLNLFLVTPQKFPENLQFPLNGIKITVFHNQIKSKQPMQKINFLACGILGLAAFSESLQMSGRNLQYDDPHCYNFDANGVCTQCSWRYEFDSNGVCREVSPDCMTWNTARQCTSCYEGWEVENGACVQSSG